MLLNSLLLHFLSSISIFLNPNIPSCSQTRMYVVPLWWEAKFYICAMEQAILNKVWKDILSGVLWHSKGVLHATARRSLLHWYDPTSLLRLWSNFIQGHAGWEYPRRNNDPPSAMHVEYPIGTMPHPPVMQMSNLKKSDTDRHGRANKVFFANTAAWRSPTNIYIYIYIYSDI
jgi:hypothetical protein